MKYIKASIFVILSMISINSFAFTLSLQATNHTNQEVTVAGGASYGFRDQPIIWQAPFPTMNKLIAPQGTNIPMSVVLKDLDNFSMEYFNFSDKDGKLLVRCLSDYYSISKDAILRFTLYQAPGPNSHYYCKRDIIKQ